MLFRSLEIISRERNNIFRYNEMISREQNNIFRCNEMISRERNNIFRCNEIISRERNNIFRYNEIMSNFFSTHVPLGAPYWTDSQYRENLRMSALTFQVIVTRIGPAISRQDTQLRKAIPVNIHIAVTIWRLATNAEYRTLSHLFSLGMLMKMRGNVGKVVAALNKIAIPITTL